MCHLGARTPIKCILCGTSWSGQSNRSHTTENPVLLPCGAIYGEECMNAQLSSARHSRDSTDPRRCKYCDQALRYANCGHSIIPHRLSVAHDALESREGKSLPLVTSASEMAQKCERCAFSALPNYRRLRILKSNHENFLLHYEDRNWTPEQFSVVAKEHADFVAEIELVEAAATVERTDIQATRRGW